MYILLVSVWSPLGSFLSLHRFIWKPKGIIREASGGWGGHGRLRGFVGTFLPGTIMFHYMVECERPFRLHETRATLIKYCKTDVFASTRMATDPIHTSPVPKNNRQNPYSLRLFGEKPTTKNETTTQEPPRLVSYRICATSRCPATPNPKR